MKKIQIFFRRRVIDGRASFKDRIHFLTQGSAESGIRLKMMFLVPEKPKNMSDNDFERNQKVRFCGFLMEVFFSGNNDFGLGNGFDL